MHMMHDAYETRCKTCTCTMQARAHASWYMQCRVPGRMGDPPVITWHRVPSGGCWLTHTQRSGGVTGNRTHKRRAYHTRHQSRPSPRNCQSRRVRQQQGHKPSSRPPAPRPQPQRHRGPHSPWGALRRRVHRLSGIAGEGRWKVGRALGQQHEGRVPEARVGGIDGEGEQGGGARGVGGAG